jgi:formate hydrogenlyase transcriptional activator
VGIGHHADKHPASGEDSAPLPSGVPDSSSATSSSAAVCLLDAQQRFVWLNYELAALNGVPASQHLGKTLKEVLGPLAEQIERHLHEVQASGEPLLNVEISEFHPIRQTPVHWRLHLFPIRDQQGNLTRVGIIVNELPQQSPLARAVQELDGKLHQQTDRLQMLAEINKLLSSNWDVPLLFPRISARIRRALRQEMASFVLYDAANHKLVRHALDFPLSKGLILQGPVSADNTPAQLALDQGTPTIFSTKELENLQSSMARSLLDEGLRSLCCVPMMRPNGPFGALILGSTRRNAFREDDLGLLTQVANQLALAMVNHLAASEIKVLRERLGEERKYLEGEIDYDGQSTEIVGSSPALREVLQQVTAVAASGATVLILGETGTGKELIARAIHRLSQRKDGPFIKVNCAAIPTGLLESELFGHEKGAFTGAISQKIGRMELAHRGTLFLDEVGEIPLELQAKLLRVLQDQEFERLGSNRTIKVDVRVLAATNRNLVERIAQNQFRSDLYYRLSVFPVLVPPLRERKQDIPMLVRYFVRKFSLRMNRHMEAIPQKTMDALLQWDWPGNIRELENLTERSLILSEGGVLRVPVAELRHQVERDEHNAPDRSLDAAERQHILRVLRETQGKLSGPDGAAKRLGLKRTTLQSKMQRLKISRNDITGRK